MDKTRIEALQTLESGTTKQRISLFIADADRYENNNGDEKFKPLLNDDERTWLQNSLDAKGLADLQNQWEKYTLVKDAMQQEKFAYAVLGRTIERLKYWQHHWALMEQMETAVNVALLQIQDPNIREATAIGLAKNIQILGCCQSVSPDGMLVLSMKAPIKDYDAESMLNDTAKSLVNQIGDYKAALEAINEAIKKYGLIMPASKSKLKKHENDIKNFWLREKYSDISTEPEIGGLGGMQDLYKNYWLLPVYDRIQANKDTKKHFLCKYLKIKTK